MMYVQENEETMPGTDFWSVVDGASGKILVCPTAGKKIANAYGYSNRVAGIGLGEIPMPTEEELTMDAVAGLENNLLLTIDDVDFRHTKKAVVSYVDGHVTLTNAVRAIYAKPVDVIQSTTTDLGMSATNPANSPKTVTSTDGLLVGVLGTSGYDNWPNQIKYGDGIITINTQGHDAINSATYDFSSIAISQNGGDVTKGWEVSFNANFLWTGHCTYFTAKIYDNSTPTAKVIASVLLWRNDEWWGGYNGRTNVYLNGTAAANRAIEVKNASTMTQAQQTAFGEEFAATLLKTNPSISIAVSPSSCTLLAGKYTISLPIEDATANWNKPTKIEFSQNGNGDNKTHSTNISNLKFAGI